MSTSGLRTRSKIKKRNKHKKLGWFFLNPIEEKKPICSHRLLAIDFEQDFNLLTKFLRSRHGKTTHKSYANVKNVLINMSKH